MKLTKLYHLICWPSLATAVAVSSCDYTTRLSTSDQSLIASQPVPTGNPTPNPSPTSSPSPTPPAPLTSRMVLIGYGGRRMASLDGGLTWAQNQVDAADGGDDTTLLRDVHYGNKLFITVGWRIMASLDAINWTTVETLTDWLGGVTYGNGTWVAVGGCGIRMYSSDGQNWNTIPNYFIGSCVHLRQVAFGNGVFFSVGDSGYQAQSTDGINWELSTETDSYTSLIFAQNRFYAIDTTTNHVMQTPPVVSGVAWTPSWEAVTNLPVESFGAITYGNGEFFFSAENALYTSTDGTTWNTVATTVNTPIIAQGGAYVTYGWDSLSRSTDLIHWTSEATNPAMTDDSINGFTVFNP